MAGTIVDDSPIGELAQLHELDVGTIDARIREHLEENSLGFSDTPQISPIGCVQPSLRLPSKVEFSRLAFQRNAEAVGGRRIRRGRTLPEVYSAGGPWRGARRVRPSPGTLSPGSQFTYPSNNTGGS